MNSRLFSPFARSSKTNNFSLNSSQVQSLLLTRIASLKSIEIRSSSNNNNNYSSIPHRIIIKSQIENIKLTITTTNNSQLNNYFHIINNINPPKLIITLFFIVPYSLFLSPPVILNNINNVKPNHFLFQSNHSINKLKKVKK